MDEYIGPTDSEKTEAVPLFESPANEATDEKNVPSKDSGDAAESSNHCSFCGRRVSLDDPTTHSEVISWIRGPRKDSSVLRKYTGSHACGDCISRIRSGLSPKEVDFETALASEREVPHPSDESIFTDRSYDWSQGYRFARAGNPTSPVLEENAEFMEGFQSGSADRELEIYLYHREDE